MLDEARLPLGTESTKWKMLRESFQLAQRQSGSANPVLTYLRLALDPGQELVAGDLGAVRAGVNEVLALSGLRLDADGHLRIVDVAKTADEARSRADRLRSRLTERGVHPDVLAFCRPELLQLNYFHAVLEATKSVGDKIRQRTGLDGDGSELVQRAFSLKNPALMVNDLANESDRSEQLGISQLAQGMYQLWRNPTAHAPRVRWAMEERETLDLLTVASMLHRRLDQARLAPGAPAYRATA
jgi:uncharacterized protein (TIGR02391 family)